MGVTADRKCSNRNVPGRRRRKKAPHRRKTRSPNCRFVFTQKKLLDVQVTDRVRFLPALDTSRQTLYSFGIVNKGEHAVEAKIEISPDDRHFAEDVREIIAGGRTAALVPYRFLRYTRVSFRALKPGEESVVDVYYQAQSSC